MSDTRADVLKYVQQSLHGDFWNSNEIKGVVGNYLNLIQYQGFDAVETVATFMKKSEKPHFGSREQDLAFLLMLFYERGSDVSKLSSGGKSRMDESGRKLVAAMKDKYGLLKMGKGANMKALTLPRLALAFPLQSCMYSNIRKNRPIVFDGPQAITVQAFSALIPTTTQSLSQGDIDHLVNANAMCMHNLSILINPDYKLLDVNSQKSLTLGFIRNGLRSQVVKETDKIQHLKDLGVLESNGSLVQSVVHLSDEWIVV